MLQEGDETRQLVVEPRPSERTDGSVDRCGLRPPEPLSQVTMVRGDGQSDLGGQKRNQVVLLRLHVCQQMTSQVEEPEADADRGPDEQRLDHVVDGAMGLVVVLDAHGVSMARSRPVP